jgi:hypothetical protein
LTLFKCGQERVNRKEVKNAEGKDISWNSLTNEKGWNIK